MDTIYITGHRNPDTDSIVSAMAYAALQNALGNRQYQAARLGQISDETQIVLDRFGFQPPRLIDNVRTQVRDLDYDTPPTLSAAATVSRGWQAMQGGNLSILPVANEDGTLYGTLSAGDVANYDITTVRNPRVEDIPVFNLISVLEGKLLHESEDAPDLVSGEVTIALPASRENLLFSSPDSVVICGDQPDMVQRALDLQVNCVIICQGEAPQELLERAGKTCVISTPIDAYQALRLIFHALPIARVCKNKDLVCFHLDDYIDDVQDAVLESRFRAYPILDEEERVVGMLSRYHLLRPRRKRVVLVDHNEKSQSVTGLDQADILEIIDHHRLADIETKNPIHVRNEAVGSTNTIIAEMYQEKGLMGRGTRKRCFLRVRMSPARGVVQAGVLEMDEWTSFSFRCRSPGACARLLPVIALEAPPLIARRNGRRHKRLPLIDGPQERGCLPLAFPLSLHLPRGVERQHAAPPVFEENQCYRVSDKKADHRGIFELRYSS